LTAFAQAVWLAQPAEAVQLKHVALHALRHVVSVFLQLFLQVLLPPHPFWQFWLVVPQGVAQLVAVEKHVAAAGQAASPPASPAASLAASPVGS
jgi:hypothetical protein